MATSIFDNEVVNDDTVFYLLFPYDHNWSPVIEEEKLKSLVAEYSGFLHTYIKDYIWFHNQFHLSVRMESSDNSNSITRPHIVGKTCIGDYTEDEWFIYYLLRCLTKAFPHLICRIYDNDGEFPLIESALHLPSWANPETAEERVFVREGNLHLVPPSVLPLSSDSPRSQITMASVGHVVHSPSATLASPAIQNAISLRIQEYPRKISKEQHSTHAFVPVGVAALLHEYPTLVSAAVRAFCYRDAIDNKCLRVMRHFPPETRVMTTVRFSKALYALLSAHPYTPDPRTGWKIPTEDNKAHVVGMKLACGFEILVCSGGGVSPSSSATISSGEKSDDSLNNNALWLKYKDSLKEKGYFRGEMEGSKLFQELEANARRFFLSNKMLSDNEDETDNLSIGSVVVKLYSSVNVDYDAFKKREKLLSPPDDENWLEVTPEDLDEMLESKFQTKEKKYKEKSNEQIAESLNTFLRYTSSFEGAEVPKELQTDANKNRKSSSTSGRKASNSGPKKLSGLLNLHHPQYRKVSSNSNASDSSELSSFSAKIDFNAESFTDALNNILELSVPEDDYFNGTNDDSSGMSSYEDDDQGDLSLSRKTSGDSTNSKASSGVDADLEAAPNPPPQRPPRRKKKNSEERKKKIPLASFEDFDCSDDDDDDDSCIVSELLQNYKREEGLGPTTSLFASLGLEKIQE